MSERTERILLEVRDLHVAYGKAEVVHGVSFDVRAGEFVVLLGRNGAGKSTILHAVSGLIPKRAGSVRYADHDISTASPRDLKYIAVSYACCSISAAVSATLLPAHAGGAGWFPQFAARSLK